MISLLHSRVFSTGSIAVGCLLVGAMASPTVASPTAAYMPQTPFNTPAPGAKGPGTPEQTLISPSDEVIDALLTGETEAALKAIADLVATSPEHTDAWVVYRAEAWKRKGDLAKAEAELSGFEQRFPESPWVAKARFERAEIARALGEHGEAEVILRQEASTLRGAERRVELGEELVQAANELMERAAEAPTDQARTQHRAKARGLLEAAHGLETSDAFRAKTALALAHLVLEQGDWPAIVQWTNAAEELMAEDSFAALEARVVAARARLASGEAMEARHGLMDAVASLESQPDGSSSRAWQDLRGNALLFLGEAWRAEGQSLFAIDAWNRLLGLEPAHDASPRVAGLIADVYVELGRTADGIDAWARAESLAAAQSATQSATQSAGADATHPTGENSLIGALQHLIEETTGEDRLDAAAYGRRALFRRAQLQAASGRHGDAIASFTEYVASHPGAEDWNAAQEGLLAARFSRAASWLEESVDASLADLEAAEAALLEFADDHPLDHRATDALFQWATIREHYADRFMRKPEADSAQEAGLEARRPFYVTSVERLEELARRTANSDQELSGRALFHAAELVQNRLEDAPRAIAIYQRVVGSHRSSAVMRLREMQETHLSVATAGLVRPGEPLVIDVDTRNIEELAVQAVRLDLGQYFQRHQTTTEIERLDLDLIAPDIEWTVPVEDYSAYANLSREVTVPAGSDDEPGVFAVTVVADGKRATTLVIRSELDVIVKRSKAEVFVLVTETDREGRAKVAPAAEVTLSYVHGGKRETTSLKTDSEGIASLLAPEDGEFGADTRVFVSRAGHVAATELAGEARGNAISLAPRADLQLDRTAYRPGDEVGFRAVIRGVEDGSWKLPTLSRAQRDSGQRYTTELIAPNGVAVARVTAEETSAYGSLSGSFVLDAAAPSGTWTVQTTSPGNPMASTKFTVGEIEVPRVSLELITEETVILRGETALIVATAQTAWGAPLAGVPIVWTDPRGVETRAMTDRDGAATLSFETKQSVAGDRLSFRAQLPEDGGIASSIQVQVAVSALDLGVSVEHPVVLAGETFNARIVASAPDGKTAPTEVRLIGTRRYETRPGRFAEQRVLDETVTTNASGEAVVAVSPEAGGSLILLATAKDRFGREVSATCSLEFAGAEDAEPLRVLANDTSIHAGESGEVRVVDRTKSGGLALMTVEGSKVLEHRVVTLVPGLNELSFAADVQHVPDVQVSVSAIRGRRFHERSATFLVTRPLVVSVEAPASLTPEGSAEIVVRTTDGLGNGVPAELSLALVDRALLAAYPDQSPSLEDLFEIRGRRTPAFVTAASSTFRYEGITEEIDAAILDEGRRAEAQQQLESMRSSVGQVLEDADDAPMSAAFDAESIAFAAAPAAPFESRSSNSVLGIGGGAGGKRGGRFAGRKRSAPQVPEVGLDQPTAYWNANVVTGSDGVARVSIPMPAFEATWQLDVAGVTADHRFGSKRAEIVTRSPLVAVIDVPVYLREGDEPLLRGEVTLEEALEADAPVAWELRVAGERSGDDEGPGTDGPRQSVQRGTSVLRAGETRLGYTFEKLPPITGEGGLLVEFRATVQGSAPGSEDLTARTVRGCAVRPAGYEVMDTAAGRVTSESAVRLELRGAKALDLTLIAGATEAQWLVDAALERGPWRSSAFGSARPIHAVRGQGALAMASQLLGAATLVEASGRSGGLAPSTLEDLRSRCDGLIGALVARVGQDGGWSRDAGCWRGRVGEATDIPTTARAIVALAAARSAGRSVPNTTWENALSLAESKLADASNDEERALLAWALESGSRGNDLVLNRLHRERARLDGSTGAALALALHAAGKQPMAAEVAADLSVAEALQKRSSGGSLAPYSRLDRAALIVLARAVAGVATDGDRRAIRGQLPWIDSVGRGTAVAAEVAAGALSSASDQAITFEVTVGSGSPQAIQLRPADGDGGTREVSLVLPEAVDETGAVQVTLRLVSGPSLDYALVLEGHVDVAPEPSVGFPHRIGAAEFRSALPRWRGRALDEGFDAVEAPASVRWENEIEGLGFGESGRIVIAYGAPRRTREDVEHDLVLEVPLPAGVAATVASGAGYGAIAPEVQDGVLLAGLLGTTRDARIVLDITGTRPGTWTLGAPVIRSAQNPGLAAFGEETQLVVHAPGAAPTVEPRPTPDERLSRGRMAFEDGDMEATLESLTPLFAEWKRALRPAALSEVARLLLFASLKGEGSGSAPGNDRSLVDWFEILKERDPGLFVSFDDTLRIAAAYRSIGEPERSNLLYKAVIDETLGEDLRVAAAMDEAGEWMRASQMAASIWRRYPDSPAADDADLALANRLIERGLGTSGQPGLSGAQRSALVVHGIARMRRKVALGEGRGTVAADAGLALVATYAQLEQWERAAARAELFARAFPDPVYQDSFRYSEAVARWSSVDAEEERNEEQRAVEILESIATVPLKSRDGSTRWSPNRQLALYILAQVYHARMDAEKAEVYYDRVDTAFADARAALQELRSERLELDEDVVRVRPGEVAEIGFDHKGIEGVSVLIYPVDLLTLALRERDLSKVTAVDLAGVTPTLEESIDLTRSVLHPAKGKIEVKLERPGAYLAMLRGGEIHRSALLLATDLELDVVAPGDGSVRAQTMLASTNSFAEGATVRVLGETSGQVESLETDRRGVATAEGLQGRVTVIARATRPTTPPEHHYAFHGTTQPVSPNTPSPPTPKPKSTNYLSNVIQQNDANLIERQQRVDLDVRRTRKGVQVQQAK